MSVNSIMQNGVSALLANQTALRTTSNNVANINTDGYVRQEAQFTPISVDTTGIGVRAQISRVADRFLAITHRNSISEASNYGQSAALVDRAQARLGDPSSGTSLFSAADNIISDASALTNDPSSLLLQSDLVSSIQSAFADVNATSTAIEGLREEADSQIGVVIQTANQLLRDIASLNGDISGQTVIGGNASAFEDQQSRLLNQLAELIDFNTIPKENGGVEVRANNGFTLADVEASTLSRSTAFPDARYSGIAVTLPGADGSIDITRQIKGGELRGLLDARDSELAQISHDLGEYASGLASALNEAANIGTPYPPPTQIEGANTGLIATDSLNFTGSAVFAVTDENGVTVESVRVDFDAGTATNSAGTVSALGGNIGSFAASLNASFGAAATVSFADGSLNLSATGTNGIAVAQDPNTPSDRAGRGVSAFFGLNDVVQSTKPYRADTGLQAADAHGFSAETITFGLRDDNGNLIQSIDYTPTAGGTLNDIVNDLNSAAVLGQFATASIDADGRLLISPDESRTATIDVLRDETLRGSTNVSLSELFSLGVDTSAVRAGSLKINTELARNPSRLASTGFNPAAFNVGDQGVAPGDNRGALALHTALSEPVTFRDINGVPKEQLSTTQLSAEIAASAGNRAAFLESRAETANAVQAESEFRRSSVEGVNLDEELVLMTQYQQSYAAASRLITAARDMFDTLLNMV